MNLIPTHPPPSLLPFRQLPPVTRAALVWTSVASWTRRRRLLSPTDLAIITEHNASCRLLTRTTTCTGLPHAAHSAYTARRTQLTLRGQLVRPRPTSTCHKPPRRSTRTTRPLHRRGPDPFSISPRLHCWVSTAAQDISRTETIVSLLLGALAQKPRSVGRAASRMDQP